MIADSLSSIPLTQAPDVKIEKNAKAEEPRAIEESDKGDNSQLDIERQNISKKRSSENMSDVRAELQTYGATDRPPGKAVPDGASDSEYESIDIVV